MNRIIHPHPTWDAYRSLLIYKNNDGGATLVLALENKDATLVGDGSYDIKYDTGSSVIICETNRSRTRTTNVCLVPSNTCSVTSQHNYPYRCELVAVMLGLLFIYDMGQRFQS